MITKNGKSKKKIKNQFWPDKDFIRQVKTYVKRGQRDENDKN